MGRFRKFLAGFVVAALMVTSVMPAFAADEAKTTATKAASGFQFEAQAKALYDAKLFAGTDTTKYVPNLEGSVTREQGIAMIIRLLGLEEESKKLPAADVEAALKAYSDKNEVSDWAKNYVALSVTKKLVKGTSDTTLSATAQMTGNMFATIILQNLGYTVDPKTDYAKAASILVEKGATYLESNAKAFADKKLIRDDFVGMAFGSLYAKDNAKDSKDSKTVLDSLIAAKVLTAADKTNLDKAQIIEDGVDATYKELVVSGVSKLTVKFGGPVADTAKVEFDVKRGGVAETLTPKWNDKKTEVTLEKSGKLGIAEYTVAIKNDGKDFGSKTVTVAEEKLASIDITSSSIIITEKGDEKDNIKPQAYFKYECKNQYGEDVTDSSYSDGIEWTISPWGDENETDRNKGMVIIREDVDNSDLYDNRGKEMSIFGYNSDENISVRKNLTINPVLGGVKEFKFTGLTNADGLKDVVQGSSDEFVLGYEAKDADGNLVDNYDVFVNEDIFKFKPDPAFDGDNSDQDNGDPVMIDLQDDDGKLKIVVKASDDPDADYGKALIVATCYTAGSSAQFEVDVKKETQVETITLQSPSDATAGKTIEIPYTAVDSDGRALTDYDDIIGPDKDGEDLTTFKLKGGSAGTDYRAESINGDLRIYVDIDAADYDETLTFTATVEDTGKSSRITFKVGEAAYPTDITGTGSALLTYVTAGGVVDEDADNLYVKDDNNNKVNIRNSSTRYLDDASGSVYYYVYVTSNYPDRVNVVNNMVYGNNKVKYEAGTSTGSATLTFKLLKDNDMNPNNGWIKEDDDHTATASTSNSPVDTYTMTVNNIKIGDVTSYELTGATTIWAIDPVESKANLGALNIANGISNSQLDEAKQEVKVHGYNSSKKEVAIPGSIVSKITVGDTTNFKIIGTSTGSKTANVYGIKADDDAKSVVTAFISADGKQYTPSAEIKSTKTAPQAVSLSVGLGDPAIDGTGSTFQDVGGGIYEITATDLASTSIMNGKTLAKFNNDGTDPGNALRVEVTDQYGKVNMIPEYIMATAKTSEGVAIDSSIFNYDSTNNVMTVSSSIPDKAIITVTASSGGKSLTFSIRINNGLVK